MWNGFRDSLGRKLYDGARVIFFSGKKRGFFKQCYVVACKDGTLRGYDPCVYLCCDGRRPLIWNKFYWENDGKRCFFMFVLPRRFSCAVTAE